MMRYVSAFWVGYCSGALRLSAIWYDREDPCDLPASVPVHPSEQITMAEWLRLSEGHRARIVSEYTDTWRTPRGYRSAAS
jgi:hypothetical protein